MNRIIVIGCCGSGKTTLSKLLSKMLDLPIVHLDSLYWRDNWQPASNDEFDDWLLAELKKPYWIIDGNNKRTMPLRLKYCDTVIFLDYDRINCLFGVIKRVITNYGKCRSDMGGNCPEKFDFDFLKYVWNFNKINRNKYFELLADNKDKKIIILKNRRELQQFIQNLRI